MTKNHTPLLFLKNCLVIAFIMFSTVILLNHSMPYAYAQEGEEGEGEEEEYVPTIYDDTEYTDGEEIYITPGLPTYFPEDDNGIQYIPAGWVSEDGTVSNGSNIVYSYPNPNGEGDRIVNAPTLIQTGTFYPPATIDTNAPIAGGEVAVAADIGGAIRIIESYQNPVIFGDTIDIQGDFNNPAGQFFIANLLTQIGGPENLDQFLELTSHPDSIYDISEFGQQIIDAIAVMAIGTGVDEAGNACIGFEDTANENDEPVFINADVICPYESETYPTETVRNSAATGCLEGPGGSGYEICNPISEKSNSCSSGCLCMVCGNRIPSNHERLQAHMSRKFQQHHDWMIDVFFIENIAYAMGQMASQMTAVSMQQVTTIGKFFDAKHQLETQALFQTLMAQAHKDYQPSMGMCDITTNVRGLLTGERKSTLAQVVLANRVMDRQLRTGTTTGMASNSDFYSRINTFKNTFCEKTDNANGLNTLCQEDVPKVTINKDVDYTRTIETPLTLEIDFSADIVETNDEGETTTGAAQISNDEKSAFALMANLFAHEVLPSIGDRVLADEAGNPRVAAYQYMDLRAVAAKRSVAQNSLSAIVAERAGGNPDNPDPQTEYAPFLKKVVVDLGVPEDEVDFILGKNPSYFAQMEVLTKKLYQNPVFYTELYDKPTNVLRKRAAIRAINLMQDRDMYKSHLRTEAVFSVILESMLNDEHKRVYDRLNRLEPNGDPVNE